jgi:hypothetical protein
MQQRDRVLHRPREVAEPQGDERHGFHEAKVAGGSETNAREQPVQAEQALQTPAATTATDEICRALMQRQRACSATFIPALVDARVKVDNPPGIAARDNESGRVALVQEAFTEWASDSKDEAIDKLCDAMAQSISPTKDTELRTSVSACLAKEGCGGFVACATPINLVRWME